MTRFLTTLLCLCAVNFLPAQKNTVNITSRINKVTVFQKGAQVERLASQTLQPGKYTLVFNGLSPQLEDHSIQLKAEGRITVLSVTRQKNFIKQQQVNDQIKELEQQQQDWMGKIAAEDNLKTVLDQEEQLLLKNQQIKGEQATLKATELKEAADFQRNRLTTLYKERSDLLARKARLQTYLQKTVQQLIALHQKKDLSTSDILATVEVKEAGAVKFQLSYLIKEAYWQAAYDIRVANITQPLALQMKAIISQHSGEDWQEVKMALSSGNPQQNGEKPVMSPWPLRFYYPEPASIRIRGISSIAPNNNTGMTAISGVVTGPDGLPLGFASVMGKESSAGTTADAQGLFSLNLPASASTIVVSSLGYTSTEIAAKPGFNRIILQPASAELSEVVVTALGVNRSGDYSYEPDDVPGKSNRATRKQIQTGILTNVNYQPTTTVFEIQEPFSVPSDSQQYRAHIQDFDVPAVYEYYAAPKLDPNAYLTAKVSNWQELNLISGEASLFFEGSFLGNSWLDL
ncbi:MAG: mucoidy inhibitor MuiA family protein, partial [Chitinophagaceae bacterium]|nr:mucoidy inhibitor MuiA family protein [Chitinophagaceae bacterium]